MVRFVTEKIKEMNYRVRMSLDILQIPYNLYLMLVKWDNQLATTVLDIMDKMPEWRRKSIAIRIVYALGRMRTKTKKPSS